MAGVAVVTDSTSSLPAEVALRAGVRVIPLQVVVDAVTRAEGEVAPAEVAAALRRGQRVSTSRPPVEAFAAVYAELAEAGHTAVVSAHLSGQISGTVAAAQLAGAAAGLPVRVVDTGVVAMAAGFAVLAAAAAAAAGAEAEQVAALVRRRAATSTTYFYVDDLAHLRRGGRIGAATAAIGTALTVKPLLTVVDGEIRSAERVRTTSRALARLLELTLGAIARAAAGGHAVDVAVHHLDDEPAAQRLADALAPRPAVASVVLTELSAVLAVHAGPGTLGLVVSPRP
jgi:DegV family protein with EDD domain